MMSSIAAMSALARRADIDGAADEVRYVPFLIAHVFTPAGAISMGTMARKLVRPH
jgi:hypothetical protein